MGTGKERVTYVAVPREARVCYQANNATHLEAQEVLGSPSATQIGSGPALNVCLNAAGIGQGYNSICLVLLCRRYLNMCKARFALVGQFSLNKKSDVKECAVDALRL